MYNLNFAFFYKLISKYTPYKQFDVVNILLNGDGSIGSQMLGIGIDKSVASKLANGGRAVDSERCRKTLKLSDSEIEERLEMLRLSDKKAIINCCKKLLFECRFEIPEWRTGELLFHSRTKKPGQFLTELFRSALTWPEPFDLGSCDDISDLDVFLEDAANSDIDLTLSSHEMSESKVMEKYRKHIFRNTSSWLKQSQNSIEKTLNDAEKVVVYPLIYHLEDAESKNELIAFCLAFNCIPAKYESLESEKHSNAYSLIEKRVTDIVESFGERDVCLSVIEKYDVGETIFFTDLNCRISARYPEILFVSAEASHRIAVETELKELLLSDEDEKNFDAYYDDDPADAFETVWGVKRDILFTCINEEISYNRIRVRMLVLDQL